MWSGSPRRSESWFGIGGRRGDANRLIGRDLGRSAGSIRAFVESSGGVRPDPRRRSSRHLSFDEREEISRGVAGGVSLRMIAGRLGRAASTISRELARNGGLRRYRAHHADRTAWRRAKRPKPSKLAENPVLREIVEEKLSEWWSPQQVVLWLQRTYPDDQEMRVSHETIYLSLFVQGKGALRRELTECLRTGRAYRRPKTKRAPSGKGKIVDPVMISERPAEVEDRAVPGHWEGDLLMGRRQTAIGTLVERHTRYVMLFPLPEGNTAEAVPQPAGRHRAAAPSTPLAVPHLGSGQGNGSTRPILHRHRSPSVFL